MAIITKQFHKREKGMGDEDWYHLARDTETGAVFVRHEWSHRDGGGYRSGEEDIPLIDFLSEGGGDRQRQLLELIGTLVQG
ncbi:MAG: hypothetical protein EOP24_24075 [Hyphomicrobiales bacterium]|nr:MAG: hypothetical protein EOP24_24075 [Hyphomicrobiales bacterium]